jgi:hypothetical protein
LILRRQVNLIAQAFESSDESFLHGLTITLCKVGFSEFPIAGALLQEMIDDHQYTMGDRYSGFLGSSSAGNTAKLCGKIGVLTACCPIGT